MTGIHTEFMRISTVNDNVDDFKLLVGNINRHLTWDIGIINHRIQLNCYYNLFLFFAVLAFSLLYFLI